MHRLISTQLRKVEVWRRDKRGWRSVEFTSGLAEVRSLACELSMLEIYRDPLP